MRKFILGLLAVLSLTLLMSSVAAAQDSQVPPPTCGEPETLKYEPNPQGWTDVYNADGQLCGQVDGELTELPRTGVGIIISAIVGFVLLISGSFALFARRYLPYARPVKH